MNIQLSTLSETRKSLLVTLDKEEVDSEHKGVPDEFTRMARLPGFRPGKAPAAMVIRKFAKEIGDEFKQKVVARAYREALEKEKLDVLNIVKVEEGSIEPGVSAAITVTVDVRPEFKLPDYVGLPVVAAPTDPTDAEVDGVVENLRSERADFKSVDRPAQKGDYVKLAYEGAVDGRPIAEIAPDQQLYAKVPTTWEEVEGTQEGVIPGLGRQIAGLKAGDKKDIRISFPATFAPVPALAGATATYAVEVLEVRERILPALDAEFFKAHQVDDLDGLKKQVRANLKLQKEHRDRVAQRGQVTQALADRTMFEPPQSLVEAETQSVLRQFIEENMSRGVPQEQFEKDKKELIEGARKAAAGRIKVQLILAKLAEAEKIDITNQDMELFVQREAMRTRQTPDKVAKALGKNREGLRSVRQSIIFDKAVDFLVSKAKVQEAKAT